MKNSTSVIAIENFSFSYANTETAILDNINLTVAPGEFIILAGKSGCGKSTLLRCLNGIIPHLLPGKLQGTIHLKGENLAAMTPEMISRHAGSVFQNPRSQFFHLNVTDEIALGPENLGLSQQEIRTRVDTAIDIFEIGHLRDKEMYALSSGEQQKVSFASIYAAGSDILFLDEPSANLDIETIASLRNILTTLKNDGKTIIIAEHRLYYLKGLFDRLILIEDGKIKKTLVNDQKTSSAELTQNGLRALDIHDFILQTAEEHCTSCESENTAIHADCLGFSYPKMKEKALDNISFSLPKGQKIAIIGRNGSGKTTLIKLLSGLLSPKQGAIFDQKKQKQKAKQRIKNCGLVLQESSHQLFYASVLDEILSAKRQDTANCPHSLLNTLGLGALLHAHPQNLSAGQQQRLVFATAVINSPQLLILDEPTSGLDAFSMRAIGEKIYQEAEKGCTVLIVTHDIEFIMLFCDHALTIANGKAGQLIPKQQFKRIFLDSFPPLK